MRGKFLHAGEQRLWVRGVTYGTFRPDAAGDLFPPPAVVETDFAAMVAHGVNAVRTYTPPPRRMLDTAARHGLQVLVGLPWEQHVTFLAERGRRRDIRSRVRRGVLDCAGHPAVLAYAVGNEIPAPIVRWHGAGRVERFLGSLVEEVRLADPGALATYVNYPTTEYLELPFLDFHAFNVFLEDPERLAAYLDRLQSLADEKPLLLTELGLDSRSHGPERQAFSVAAQVGTAFRGGCAGAFVFSWTDEWHRGGHDVADWDFGLVDRERAPKPALAQVAKAFAAPPFPERTTWPKVSVVVCSLNGARTIRDTFEGLAKLAYPDFDVLLVDDGSTDSTGAIAREFGVEVVATENRGLSAARNTGWQHARGEIVAYIDDDAWPDPHWLHYLVHRIESGGFAGAGGPNRIPRGDGPIAECVANAPGGPNHVLVDDRTAEHIPGCNMAFRRDCLAAVDGFDPQFRAAGDDVDLCWRIQEAGWRIGYHAAAHVWHHRRNSVRAYWRQQIGYGKAEALLERKWPDRYNALGHVQWGGRIYGRGLTVPLHSGRARIYQGVWGSAPFQAMYQGAPGTLASLPLTPEWLLGVVLLGLLSALAPLWSPLAIALPLLLLATGLTLAQAVVSAARARFTRDLLRSSRRPGLAGLRLRALVAALHLVQPAARLYGRLRHGLTMWRRYPVAGWSLPLPQQRTLWCEQWTLPAEWLRAVQADMEGRRVPVRPGSEFDDWDLTIRAGVSGAVRLRMTVEEHGAGRQFYRFGLRPAPYGPSLVLAGALAVVTAWAAADGAWLVAGLLAAPALLLAGRVVRECGAAMARILQTLQSWGAERGR
ncbi:MAG TPA: glycosyltransferase [Planctomycetota bacterium]